MEAAGICAQHRLDDCPVPSKYLTHSHDSYEIFLALSGGGWFQAADSRYPLAPGDVMLLRCGEPHRLLVCEGEPVEYLYVQFVREVLPPEPGVQEAVGALFDNRDQGTLNRHQLAQEPLAFLQMCMQRLADISSGNAQEQFLTYIRPILQELFRHGNPLAGEPCAARTDDARGTALFERVAEYISAHFAEIKDLRFVPEVFRYSTVYVNSLFRERIGVSIWQYVLRRRIDYACDLMLNGMSTGQAALACGFEDYSTFYRIFCKNYGMTPSACKHSGQKPRLRPSQR